MQDVPDEEGRRSQQVLVLHLSWCRMEFGRVLRVLNASECRRKEKLILMENNIMRIDDAFVLRVSKTIDLCTNDAKIDTLNGMSCDLVTTGKIF